MNDNLTYINRAASGLSHAVVPGTLTTACGREVDEDETQAPGGLLNPCPDCAAFIARATGGK